MYFEKKEIDINKEYSKNGYLIQSVANTKSFQKINDLFHKILRKKINSKTDYQNILNSTHKFINKKNLNDFRLSIMKELNDNKKFKSFFYDICKPYVNSIVGNELAMQKNINLSIQNPQDDSSL